jgi:hypothetical protein
MLVVIMPWRLRQMAQELIEIAFGNIEGAALLKAIQNEPGVAIRSRYPDDLDSSHWASTSSPEST